MNEFNLARALELLGALGFGGFLTAVAGKWITGGDAKLADGAAVRSELWERVESLEKKVEDLSTKYQKEHDERVRSESFVGAFVQAYSDVRHKGLQMAEKMRQNDVGWRVYADELEKTPNAEVLFDRIVTKKRNGNEPPPAPAQTE